MYQFQFAFNFDDFDALNLVYRKKEGLSWRQILRIALTFLVLSVLIMKTSPVNGWVDGIVRLAIVTVSSAIAEFVVSKIEAKRSKALSVQDAGELTITLDEIGIHDHSMKGDATFPWKSFVGGYHCKNRYFLFFDEHHAYILPERAIVAGDPATIKAFLEEKLQKEVKEIR